MKREREKLRQQLVELEQALAATPGLNGSSEADGDISPRAFVSGAINAIALIRREELDAGKPGAYSRALLPQMHSEMLAQFLAALAMREHPDEYFAKALLEAR